MNDNIIFGLHILKERTNNNMKKRLVTLIVAGTLIMSSLAGCGSVSDVETDATPQAQEETVVENVETPAETGAEVEETTESAEETKAIEATEHLTKGRASLYGLDGTEFNLESAYNEFAKAVELGNAEANFYLGLLCDWYSYPEENFEMAKTYYEACGDNAYAKINLALLYFDGDGVAEDKEKASVMFQEVIDQGYVEGYLGSACVASAEENYEKALEDFNKVLEGKEQAYIAYALTELGNMYYGGTGVEQDYAKALELWEEGSSLGQPVSMYDCAWLYQNGYGVEQDYAKAIEMYLMSAKLGCADAYNELGWLYQNGEGVEQDYAKAFEYYKLCADSGIASGMTNVGWFYENGLGVEQDYEKALEYYDKGAELGSESAKTNAEYLRQRMQ